MTMIFIIFGILYLCFTFANWAAHHIQVEQRKRTTKIRGISPQWTDEDSSKEVTSALIV